MQLDCAGRPLDLTTPVVMGILNVTPDSFSDGGKFVGRDSALRQAWQMVTDGAAILDIGGESTRPGAAEVSIDEELDRVIPIIEALRHEIEVPLSIDTSKPEVMAAAVAAGAGLINDVMALRAPGALEVAASLEVPICLMHMQGRPRTMQQQPHYEDVVAEVAQFLIQRVDDCRIAGIAPERILVDPGFGFGKSLEHNLALMRRLESMNGIGAGLLIGVSRKSMIGGVLDLPVDQRLNGGIALASIAVWQGARVIRVHDVKASVEAVKMVAAVVSADDRGRCDKAV